MCHCGRWFSRLDNLRQHSSTVHADEAIPGDSLAATGTRYQRHTRNERVRQPGVRSRAHSTSDVQPLEPQPPQAANPPTLIAAPNAAQSRPRPDPIMVPQDVAPQTDSAFNQYRGQTPPDSPSSAASPTYSYRVGTSYRQRPAPYPPVSSSPMATPVSRSNRNSRNFDSPYSTPNTSARNSLNLSNLNMNFSTPDSNIASRRLSMPQPPTPSLIDASRGMVLPMPQASPTCSEYSTDSRRDSLSPLVTDDRRKTWHMGSPSGYQSPLPRDILSPTANNFARTSTHGPSPASAFEPNFSSIGQSRFHDRLPSINHILQESAIPPNPLAVEARNPLTMEAKRVSWAGSTTDSVDRRMSSDLGRSLHDGNSISSRRIAPGQIRSSHGRSVSNIETKRWGVVINNPNINPMPTGPWEYRREQTAQPTSQFSNDHQQYSQLSRNTSYNSGGQPGNITSPREHRQSFGSSGDSSVSEGVTTPVASQLESSAFQPRIFGEPGEAVFRSEVGHPSGAPRPRADGYEQTPEKDFNNGSWQMSGIESTGRPATPLAMHEGRHVHQYEDPRRRSMYGGSVSRLEALVSVATGAAKI